MNNLFIINHYPDVKFQPIPFIEPVIIDIKKSVTDKLKEGEKLTNATALKIFKQIKCKTEVILFILKPYVILPFSMGLVGIGLILPKDKAYLIALRLIIVGTGAVISGYVIENNLNGMLPYIADVYRNQKNKLVEYINKIENSKDEFNFVL